MLRAPVWRGCFSPAERRSTPRFDGGRTRATPGLRGVVCSEALGAEWHVLTVANRRPITRECPGTQTGHGASLRLIAFKNLRSNAPRSGIRLGGLLLPNGMTLHAPVRPCVVEVADLSDWGFLPRLDRA